MLPTPKSYTASIEVQARMAEVFTPVPFRWSLGVRGRSRFAGVRSESSKSAPWAPSIDDADAKTKKTAVTNPELLECLGFGEFTILEV